MIPREALTHVRTIEHCTAEEAEQQLRKALRDGKLIARWDEPNSMAADNPALIAPFRVWEGWLEIHIDWDIGEIADPAYLLVGWIQHRTSELGHLPKNELEAELERSNPPYHESAERIAKNYGFTLPIRRFLLQRSDVHSLWSRPDTEPAVASETIYKTGVAGKPTSWHLVEAEVRRRWNSGEGHERSTIEWAREMDQWLTQSHPSAPPLKEKSLKNHLAPLLREISAGVKAP